MTSISRSNNKVEGIVTVRNSDTKEVILGPVNNAIHYGNLAAGIVKALSGSNEGHVHYIGFGNGGTSIDVSGNVIYKTSNSGLIADTQVGLYNETYSKVIETVNPSYGISNFADLQIIIPLDYSEPSDQQLVDRALTNQDYYVFDEIGIFVGPPGIVSGIDGSLSTNNDALMVTHLIFHPIQKSANVRLEIEYVIRIHVN